MITYYLDTITDPNHPRLMRAVNFNTPQPVAETLENLQFAYNFADGTVPAPVNQFVVPNCFRLPPATTKTRFVLSTFTWAPVPVRPPRSPARCPHQFGRRRSPSAAWPISILISNEELHDEIAQHSMRKQSGIALITTLLLLLLMSAMVVGFILLVTEGQRLSGWAP